MIQTFSNCNNFVLLDLLYSTRKLLLRACTCMRQADPPLARRRLDELRMGQRRAHTRTTRVRSRVCTRGRSASTAGGAQRQRTPENACAPPQNTDALPSMWARRRLWRASAGRGRSGVETCRLLAGQAKEDDTPDCGRTPQLTGLVSKVECVIEAAGAEVRVQSSLIRKALCAPERTSLWDQ
jgi:hypothetical protein